MGYGDRTRRVGSSLAANHPESVGILFASFLSLCDVTSSNHQLTTSTVFIKACYCNMPDDPTAVSEHGVESGCDKDESCDSSVHGRSFEEPLRERYTRFPWSAACSFNVNALAVCARSNRSSLRRGRCCMCEVASLPTSGSCTPILFRTQFTHLTLDAQFSATHSSQRRYRISLASQRSDRSS